MRAMASADTRTLRRDGRFTLFDLRALLVVVPILLAVAVGFQSGVREHAGDASAKVNIRAAIPAIEAYRADYGTYAGMTPADLKSRYSPDVAGIVVLSAATDEYCVRAGDGTSTWFLLGPGGTITQRACS